MTWAVIWVRAVVLVSRLEFEHAELMEAMELHRVRTEELCDCYGGESQRSRDEWYIREIHDAADQGLRELEDP